MSSSLAKTNWLQKCTKLGKASIVLPVEPSGMQRQVGCLQGCPEGSGLPEGRAGARRPPRRRSRRRAACPSPKAGGSQRVVLASRMAGCTAPANRVYGLGFRTSKVGQSDERVK